MVRRGGEGEEHDLNKQNNTKLCKVSAKAHVENVRVEVCDEDAWNVLRFCCDVDRAVVETF